MDEEKTQEARHRGKDSIVTARSQPRPRGTSGQEACRPTTRSTGTQTELHNEPASTITPNKDSKRRSPTPTRADLIARVLNCPFPHPSPFNPPETDLAPSAPTPTRGRRGRPRKASTSKQQRRVRFTDQVPSDAEPQLRARDSHVFVRLLKISVDVHAPGSPGSSSGGQRQEFLWNNRSKGWRRAGVRSEENLAGLAELFGMLPVPGASVRGVVVPTEGGGVRQPVEVAWDGVRGCFLGLNQDGETLSVALGEMRDMARHPWARQFVGYVMR